MFPLKSLTKTFFLLAILSSVHAEAREHRWTHFGLRPLGMGNACQGSKRPNNTVEVNNIVLGVVSPCSHSREICWGLGCCLS